MIDNRQKAAMFIAVINKASKLVSLGVKLKSFDIIQDALIEDLSYRKLAQQLLAYLSEDNDPLLYGQLEYLIETKDIQKFSSTLEPSETRMKIDDLCSAIDNLREYGIGRIEQRNESFPNLTPPFCNEKAKELLQRAVKAKYLDGNYVPLAGVEHFELKLIAFGIAEILDMPLRRRWCSFDELWKLDGTSLGRYHIPKTKAKEIMRITDLYPEVDFRSVINAEVKIKRPFGSGLTREQAIFLFNSLRRNGYIALKTKEEEFLAMLGLELMPQSYIKWTATMYALAYFVKIAFADNTRDIWRFTTAWFIIEDNKILNHETLKSKGSYIGKHRSEYPFCDELDKIITETRKVE